MELRVEGAERVPRRDPVMLVARHYHHFWDGAILIGTIPRPIHILVGLDWLRFRPARAGMELLCAAAGWPVILRTDHLDRQPGRVPGPAAWARQRREAARHLRRAAAQTTRYLRRGGLVLLFPEGYPTIDPIFTPKRDDAELLPFRPGFAQLVELAQADGRTRVPIIPVGFAYQRGRRWRATVRFGEPLFLAGRAERDALVREVERQVRALSDLPPAPASSPPLPGPGEGVGG